MRAAKWQNEPECMHETGEMGGLGVPQRGKDCPFLLRTMSGLLCTLLDVFSIEKWARWPAKNGPFCIR